MSDNKNMIPGISVKQQLGPALIQALILVILRLFTIPLRIWLGAMARLAELHEETRNESDSTKTTEFPVLDWFRRAWDGVILLWWVGGGIVVSFGLLGGIFIYGFMESLGGALMSTVVLYFSVIFISLMKESMILLLSIATNVESIRRKRS